MGERLAGTAVQPRVPAGAGFGYLRLPVTHPSPGPAPTPRLIPSFVATTALSPSSSAPSVAPQSEAAPEPSTAVGSRDSSGAIASAARYAADYSSPAFTMTMYQHVLPVCRSTRLLRSAPPYSGSNVAQRR